MRNKPGLILASALTLAIGFGCSTITDIATGKKTDANSGVDPNSPETMLREKTGVPECDSLMDFLADQSKTKDDNWATRGVKELFFNKIRESIKENIDKNKNDKKEMAKQCTDIRKQFEAQLDKDKQGANK